MAPPPTTGLQSTWPSPSLSPPDPPPDDPFYRSGLSLTTIGCIIGFHTIFAVLLVLSTVFGCRLWTRRAAEVSLMTHPRRRKRRKRAEKPKPKLWEVKLDVGRERGSGRSGVAMRDWQASHPWMCTSTKPLLKKKDPAFRPPTLHTHVARRCHPSLSPRGQTRPQRRRP